MQSHRGAGAAVTEGVLQQVGQDLGHRAGVALPLGQLAGTVPGTPLQGRGGCGPLQQGLEQGGQRLLVVAPQAGGQQQGRRLPCRGEGRLHALESVDRIHVALQLVFLLQQSLHQGAVAGIVFKPAPQQLAERAQGRQGIAQLVHQHLQLLPLLVQAQLQLVVLQIEAESLGEAMAHGQKPPLQGLRPGQVAGFHQQGAQQRPPLAHGQPAAVFRGLAQLAVAGEGAQCPAGTGPVTDRNQIRSPAVICWFSDVHHHRGHITAVGELGQLGVDQAQKPLGNRHLGLGRCAFRRWPKKVRTT